MRCSFCCATNQRSRVCAVRWNRRIEIVPIVGTQQRRLPVSCRSYALSPFTSILMPTTHSRSTIVSSDDDETRARPPTLEPFEIRGASASFCVRDTGRTVRTVLFITSRPRGSAGVVAAAAAAARPATEGTRDRPAGASACGSDALARGNALSRSSAIRVSGSTSGTPPSLCIRLSSPPTIRLSTPVLDAMRSNRSSMPRQRAGYRLSSASRRLFVALDTPTIWDKGCREA
mmetsp:Transcript_51802/g.143451  ORF Transcript_51802/g.143451 Transcript_51802/m.143451 type:complete len:231 (+) Transcript_51802:736-1428(+)